MKKIIFILLLILIVGCSTQNNVNEKKQMHDEDYIFDLPKEDISQDEINALALTLDDEYKAFHTYENVLDKFGDVKPFSNIINAEVKHYEELLNLYEKYNLTPPKDRWVDSAPIFDSIKEACEAGVQAEIDNANLYNILFIKVDNQDITQVFTSLRDASEFKHLPAFERCANKN